MKFRVRTLRKAKQDYRKIVGYIADRSKHGAVAWANAFDRALQRLAEEADCFPVAPESEYLGHPVREVLFKTRRGLVYRAIFLIEGDEVFVLHVRGPGQDLLGADELNLDIS